MIFCPLVNVKIDKFKVLVVEAHLLPSFLIGVAIVFKLANRCRYYLSGDRLPTVFGHDVHIKHPIKNPTVSDGVASSLAC